MNGKKILISSFIIAAVSAGGYFGSQALFTDTETSTTAQFTVGTLDLDVDNNNGQAFDNFEVSNIGVDETLEGGRTWTINNTGSLPGRLTFALDNLVNYENGCNEPEALVDTTCSDPGPGEGDMGPVVDVTVLFNDQLVVTSDYAEASQPSYEAQWLSNLSNGDRIIPPGGSVTVTMNWVVDHDSYGNEVQSDSLEFDTVFTLDQVAPVQAN